MLQIKKVTLHANATANPGDAADVDSAAAAELQPKEVTTASIITLSPSEFITTKSNTYTKPFVVTHKTQLNAPPVTSTGLISGSEGSTASTSSSSIATASNNRLVLQQPTASQKKPFFLVKSATQNTPGTTASTITERPQHATTTRVLMHAPSGAVGHIESLSTTTVSSIGENSNDAQMEHSYLRDPVRSDISNGLTSARTVLVRRAPQCFSCHTHPLDENELNETNHSTIPAYDEIVGKESMLECTRIAKYVKNQNSDDDDWTEHVNKFGWTSTQQTVFEKVTRILDYDQLARLANESRPHEAIQRRANVDKSATRMRRVLASIAWETRITQWLHSLLMDHLPPTYMASYLDIMQTLKTKLPTLTDKMLFSRPLYVSQELLAPVMKRQWEPVITPKSRLIKQNAVMIAVPTTTNTTVPQRIQNWYKHLSTITQIVQIAVPDSNGQIAEQSLEQLAEIIVSLVRVKIHDLRTENPNRGIILLGFNAGASLALQVAISESVACVICMGFAYNTLNGVRGNPDDRILDIKAPILFVIGQKAARTSQEEMESLREKMQSESSLVVVGSADDALRVPKSRRKIENVTQSMVDSMVVDEVYDFINRTLANPPGPRVPTMLSNTMYRQNRTTILSDGSVAKVLSQPRKRKPDGSFETDATPAAKSKYMAHKSRDPKVPKLNSSKYSRNVDPYAAKRKVGRPRTRPLITPTGNASNISNSVVITKPSPNITDEHVMSDSNELNPTSSSTISSDKIISTAGSLKNVINTVGSLQKPTIITTTGAAIKPTTLAGAKIKMIPSSQFMQFKTLPSQSKIYTIKSGQGGGTVSTASIGSIVKTLPTANAGQQQIFTLKTPSGQTQQFVTAATSAGTQPKYTVIKNPNGTTMLQLTKTSGGSNVNSVIAPTSGAVTSNSNIDLSNIIDMPIIFADGDGALDETQSSEADAAKRAHSSGAVTRTTNSSNVGKLIISQKIIKEAGTSATIATNSAGGGTIITTGTGDNTGVAGKQIILNKPISALGQPNNSKVVYLNRNVIKPVSSNMFTRAPGATQLPQFAKIVIANPKGQTGTGGDQGSSIMKTVNLQGLRTATGNTVRQSNIINMNGNKLQLISTSNSLATVTNSNVDRPQIRNIVLKPGGLKQVPQHLGNQLLNRNVTVRKLNIVPSARATNIGGTITTGAVPTSIMAVSEAASVVKKVPKIITINPQQQQAQVVEDDEAEQVLQMEIDDDGTTQLTD